MENDLVQFVTSNAVPIIGIIALITAGFTELVKKFLIENSKYAPLVSLVIGGILGFCFAPYTVSYNILAGLLGGLTASGLYSGVKKLRE